MLSETEEKLLNEFKLICDRAEIDARSFPDFYLSKSVMASCEIASFFDKRFRYKWALHLMASETTGIIMSQLDARLGAETLIEYYSMDKNNEFSLLASANHGNPQSIYEIALEVWAEKRPRLQRDEITGIEKTLGEKLTDLMFFDSEELYKKYDTLEKIYQLSEYLISDAHKLSYGYLNLSIFSLHNLLSLEAQKQNVKTISDMVLRLPHKLRKNLLILNTYHTNGEELFITTLKTLEFSDREVSRDFLMGKGKTPLWEKIVNFDYVNFISSVSSLEKHLNGVIETRDPILIIANLSRLLSKNPNLAITYSTKLNLKKYKSFDVQEFVAWSKLVARGDVTLDSNSSFKEVLIAEVRYILANRKAEKKYQKDILELFLNNPHVFQESVLTFKSDLQLLRFLDLSASNGRGNKDKKRIEILINDIINQPNFGCGDLSENMCKQVWRDLQLDDYTQKNFKISWSEYIGTDCRFFDNYLRVIKNKMWAGSLTNDILNFCSGKTIAEIFESNEELLGREISQVLGYPSANPLTLMTNEGLWRNKSLGLVFFHISNNTTPKGIINLPSTGVVSIAMSNGANAAVFNSIMDSNALSSNDLDNYWESTKPLHAIASAYADNGAFEMAYSAQVMGLQRSLEENFERGFTYLDAHLSRLKHYGRIANIPEYFLEPTLNQLSISIEQKVKKLPEDFRDNPVNYHAFDEHTASDLKRTDLEKRFFKQFKSEWSLMDLPDTNDKNLPQLFLENYGKYLQLNNSEIRELCSKPQFVASMDRILENPEFSQRLKYYNALDQIVYYENIRFTSICRIEKNNNGIGTYLSLNDLFNLSIIPFLSEGLNPIDIRLLDFYEELSINSRKEDNLVGAIISSVALKHILTPMMDSFVHRDSSMIRNRQASVETIIVNARAAASIENLSLLAEGGEDQFRINYLINSLAINFHLPILSNRTRERFLFTDPNGKLYKEKLDSDDGFRNRYDKFKSSQKYNRKLLSTANDPLDYTLKKANLGNHSFQFAFGGFKLSNIFHQVFTENHLFKKPKKNVYILNVLMGSTEIYTQLFIPHENHFGQDAVTIDREKVETIRDLIVSSGGVTTKTSEALCELFAPFHARFFTSGLPLGSDTSIVVVPSVKLFPIPIEFIIGSACNGQDFIYVYAGDMVAALEFSLNYENIQLPNTFVGVGNPMANKNEFKISILSDNATRNSLLNDNFSVEDFIPLPEAAQEIIEISDLFENSNLFLNKNGSIINALEVAQEFSSKKKSTAITFATHGVPVNYKGGVSIPGLLSAENDGIELISAPNISNFDLENAIVALSACDTASGFTDNLDLFFTGFVQSFADTGADFILASLWPVVSEASKNNTENFFKTLKNDDILTAIKVAQNSVTNKLERYPFIYITP